MVDERGWAKKERRCQLRVPAACTSRRARSRDDVDERRDAGAGARRVPAHARDAAGAEVARAPLEVARSPPREQWLPSRSTWAPRQGLVVLAAAPEPPEVSPRIRDARLGFFRARVDMMLEDDDEAAISRVVAPGADGANALWAVELDLFLREPTSPLNKKEARALERVSLTFECEFAPRDEGVYPSRGAAGARNSRFFANDAVGAPGTFWIADEPGYWTIPAAARRGVRDRVRTRG